MKKILLISICLNIALITDLIYLKNFAQTKTITSINQAKKIAILTPMTHKSLIEIEKGFIKTLNQNADIKLDIKTFNANGNKVLLRSQTEEIINNDYDLIFAITTQCALMAKEITAKKNKLIPIVFGAVNRPEKLNLIKSIKNSENNLTGIIEYVDYKEEIDALLKIKPTIKNILLVYNPLQGAGLNEDKQEIEKILKEKNINLKSIEVYQTNEINLKVAGQLNNIDLIYVLKDNTVVSGIDCLLKIAKPKNIPVLTTDLDSFDKGADISFGVKEKVFGKLAANQALLILEKNIKPSQIASVIPTEYKIKIK